MAVLRLCLAVTAVRGYAPLGSRRGPRPLQMSTVERPPTETIAPARKLSVSAPPPVLSDARDMVDAFEADEASVAPEDGEASQSPLGYATDAVTGFLFNLLHVADDSGIEDSSKNLRVLWARALLHDAGELHDPVAHELLPTLTRDVARWDALKPLARFAEFVTSRTNFIDAALDRFLNAVDETGAGRPQVVVLGAGFDTRAMRYAERATAAGASFFELDLPHVCSGKSGLWDRWASKGGREGLTKPRYVPYDLNDAGDPDKAAPLDVLESAGFSRDRPTLFCSEAVLFYVDDLPKRRLFQDLLLASTTHADSAVVVTDNLKPLLPSPFTHEARNFFERSGFDLLKHSARWGGAVHYAFAARRASSIHATLAEGRDAVATSYLPVFSRGAGDLQARPTFENAWYAVCFSKQLERRAGDDQDELGYTPYATRLFGEPMVIYRDAAGEVNAVADACPHRSAPLSMGRVGDDGSLRCFYHGWAFGKDGVRTDVESYRADGSLKPSACTLKSFAAAEVDGLVYVWRGNLLEADATKLPRGVPDATPTYPVDTVLDYKVGFEYIVENNLDSVHLFHLHDGSIPPIAALGMRRDNTENLLMKAFSDDVGPGHVGKLRGALKPNKLVRFDAPNIVRHGGVSGFHEEFHIVPVAPKRTRVLLRQHLPKGPILTTVTQLPGVPRFLEVLVNNWNYHIGLEDYSVMQGQAHLIDDLGAPRINRAGKGDDLVAKFYQWYNEALENDGGQPYFARWTGGASYERQTVENGRTPRDFSDIDDGPDGTIGIKETFHAVHPVASFPPANPEPYLPKWNAQVALFRLLGIPLGFNPQE
mmetsp:Transcript_1938/g.5759  ORF Transcript_1938/g.5759 Transcript_1938/m.5759 type:complete len:822 (-) Transcript_1938:78-2543(-)